MRGATRRRPSGATRHEPTLREARGKGAERRQSSRSGVSPRQRLKAYLVSHAQVLLSSLGRLYRAPVNTLMTAAVIGIALALPGSLLVLLDNLQTVTGGWDGDASISLYLKPGVSDAAVVAARLQAWPEIASTRSMNPDEALAEFRRLSGFGDALDALERNPLPAVVVLTPTTPEPEKVRTLLERLAQQPEVDLAQLDLEWLQRLTVIMELGRRGVLAIGLLLGLGVLLIVGNTIRLEILNRREEIEITRLVGGTDAFIRRPFLYNGLLHGLLGALITWALVEAAFVLLQGPVQQLAGLYASDFRLHTLGHADVGLLLLTGALLGLLGSWLAVGRHLGRIEPN